MNHNELYIIISRSTNGIRAQSLFLALGALVLPGGNL